MNTTSLEAYYDLIKSGKAQTLRCKVLKCILDYHKMPYVDGVTRRQIGRELDMELGTVAGRVNELKASGAVIESGTAIDPKTKKAVGLIKLVGERPKTMQRELGI